MHGEEWDEGKGEGIKKNPYNFGNRLTPLQYTFDDAFGRTGTCMYRLAYILWVQ